MANLTSLLVRSLQEFLLNTNHTQFEILIFDMLDQNSTWGLSLFYDWVLFCIQPSHLLALVRHKDHIQMVQTCLMMAGIIKSAWHPICPQENTGETFVTGICANICWATSMMAKLQKPNWRKWLRQGLSFRNDKELKALIFLWGQRLPFLLVVKMTCEFWWDGFSRLRDLWPLKCLKQYEEH